MARVEITESGRGGSIRYVEGEHRLTFHWEFGGGDALASLLVLALKTSVPLLSAIWYFLVPGVPMVLRDWLFAPSVEEVVRQREEIQARLDPIYTERLARLRARDPEGDVREAVRRGEVALLPYTPGGDDYLGIEGPPPLDVAPNQRVIAGSDHLAGIVSLLAEDETHPRTRIGQRETYDYAVYYSEVFQDFVAARLDYVTRFNTAMAEHLPR